MRAIDAKNHLFVKPEGFECDMTGSNWFYWAQDTLVNLTEFVHTMVARHVMPFKNICIVTEGELLPPVVMEHGLVAETCTCHRCMAARLILDEAMRRAQGHANVGAWLDKTLGVLWGREMQYV